MEREEDDLTVFWLFLAVSSSSSSDEIMCSSWIRFLALSAVVVVDDVDVDVAADSAVVL